jgi:hypothetical protein
MFDFIRDPDWVVENRKNVAFRHCKIANPTPKCDPKVTLYTCYRFGQLGQFLPFEAPKGSTGDYTPPFIHSVCAAQQTFHHSV